VSLTAREYAAAVPPEFSAALAAAFPRQDGLPWLYPRWEPGDDWAPIERWVVWEVHPWALVPAEDQAVVRAALEGPNPRATGHYCAAGWCLCDVKRHRWTGGPHEGTDYFRQWQVAQELRAAGTPGYARVVWIVQGDQGGHPPVMDPIDRQLAAAAELPTSYPEAGAAPYAPLDARVIRGLVVHDRLRDARGIVGALKSADQLALDTATRAQQAADALFEFIAARTHQSAEEWAFWERKATGHLVSGAHGDRLVTTDRDAFKRQFIEDTALVPVSL
jgi:hypothetical protein